MDSFKDGFIIQFSNNYNLKKLNNIKNPIIIQGFPGIGNIGKLTVDFIIKQLKAKQILTILSSYLPNTVVVNEKNLINFLSIRFYHTVYEKRNFIFISGETQPTNEYNSYITAEKIVSLIKETNPTKIITLGGIGLANPVEKPRIFITSTNRKNINDFKKMIKDRQESSKDHRKQQKTTKATNSKVANKKIKKIDSKKESSKNSDEKTQSQSEDKLEFSTELFGFVGPIVGLTGLVPAIADRYKISNAILLTETVNNPFYFGIREARNMILFLSGVFNFKTNLNDYDKMFKNNSKGKLKNKSKEELLKIIPKNNNSMPTPNELSYIG